MILKRVRHKNGRMLVLTLLTLKSRKRFQLKRNLEPKIAKKKNILASSACNTRSISSHFERPVGDFDEDKIINSDSSHERARNKTITI